MQVWDLESKGLTRARQGAEVCRNAFQNSSQIHTCNLSMTGAECVWQVTACINGNTEPPPLDLTNKLRWVKVSGPMKAEWLMLPQNQTAWACTLPVTGWVSPNQATSISLYLYRFNLTLSSYFEIYLSIFIQILMCDVSNSCFLY